jgi:hypothetical protein
MALFAAVVTIVKVSRSCQVSTLSRHPPDDRRPQEVAEIVGERVKLETHGIGGERPARQPRPADRTLALLYPLLRRAAAVVESTRILYLVLADTREDPGNASKNAESYFHPPFSHAFSGSVQVRHWSAKKMRLECRRAPRSSGGIRGQILCSIAS